jgi:hypothetical protein
LFTLQLIPFTFHYFRITIVATEAYCQSIADTATAMATLNNEVPLQLTKRLQDVIYYSLDQHLYDNAVFFAERLVAYESTKPQNVHLLARCYCAIGQVKDAYELLRGNSYPACQYLFAWCAVKLNHLPEAENALCNLIKEAEKRDEVTLNAPEDQDFVNYYESWPAIQSSLLGK